MALVVIIIADSKKEEGSVEFTATTESDLVNAAQTPAEIMAKKLLDTFAKLARDGRSSRGR